MKVFDLTGAQLDYWVAKAQGYRPVMGFDNDLCEAPGMPDDLQLEGIRGGTSDIYAPSAYWEQAGPIIERHGISLEYNSGHWIASVRLGQVMIVDDKPLRAAMLCLVMLKFGHEVPEQ